jgi:hypothetical protein
MNSMLRPILAAAGVIVATLGRLRWRNAFGEAEGWNAGTRKSPGCGSRCARRLAGDLRTGLVGRCNRTPGASTRPGGADCAIEAPIGGAAAGGRTPKDQTEVARHKTEAKRTTPRGMARQVSTIR